MWSLALVNKAKDMGTEVCWSGPCPASGVVFFTLPFKQRLHGPSIAEELLENWFMLEETGNLVVLAF